MAQTLYDTSLTRSFQGYSSTAEISSHVPDKMKTASAKLSQVNYNMSQGRSAPKQRLSRLELLRNDYNKRLQMEREEKISKLRVIQQGNSVRQQRSNNSGGTVRQFFAERRALEATREGQKNAELLPPIESHFKKVKEHKKDMQLRSQIKSEQPSQTNPPVGKRISLKQEPYMPQKTLQAPPKHTARTQPKQTGVLVRKRTKGIDKQNPLPPVNRGDSDAAKRKPPTPNKRYETHSVLMQDEGNDFESLDPFMPIPPIQRKPIAKRSKAPLRPPSGEESVSDYDDALSTLTDHSSVPPNLSKLKAKALKQKQLSKQRLNVTNQEQDSGKLTDFQKWQMEQDAEREQRLKKHRHKSETSEVSLSQRERDLLHKIQEEQAQLESLKHQRKELEEQEKKQKEEEEKWLTEKQNLEQSLLVPQDSTQESNETKKKVSKKVVKSGVQHPLKEKIPPARTQEDLNESENIHDNAYSNFYAEMAEGLNEVVVDVSPCSICGRKFAPDRLVKHEKVCAKAANPKRKVFDTSKHRSLGTDNEEYIRSGKHLQEPEKRPKVDWRVQHENFIKAIRYAKGASDEPPPPSENPDYVRCPHCERKFNPATAERHIPKCKDIKAKPSRLKKKR